MAGFSKPVPAAPLVDLQTGRINLAWLNWILNIDGAVGSGSGSQPLPVVSDVTFDTPNTTGRIASLEGRFNGLEALVYDVARPRSQSAWPPLFVSSNIPVGSGVALANNTPTDITHISLTPGTWLVFGNVVINPAVGTTVTVWLGWTSITSATLPTLPNQGAEFQISNAFPASATLALPVGLQIITVGSSAQNVYLSTYVTWGTAQPGGYGFLGAVRLGN